MALYSRLPSGGNAASRSTAIYTGSTQCPKNTEVTVCEFAGGGKVNKVRLRADTSSNNSGSYFAIIVDDAELYRMTYISSTEDHYLLRDSYGELALRTNAQDTFLPLDIEFKNSFKIVAYALGNSPNVQYNLEVAKN